MNDGALARCTPSIEVPLPRISGKGNSKIERGRGARREDEGSDYFRKP